MTDEQLGKVALASAYDASFCGSSPRVRGAAGASVPDVVMPLRAADRRWRDGREVGAMMYVSLFSGIEAASVAWEPLGWEPVALSEIEPFPCAVLAERFPHVPNLGDVTKIDWSVFRERYGSVDLVCGGSPCQSFSIAGKREGLSGASGLMWEYVRAVRELRPRYFVWENVPGALSSGKGEDFRCLLRAMDELGYGLAWRVLDAQFFGVAQRRRRLFLVGCLGDPERAAEILFERESLRWDYPSSREKRQELTGAIRSGTGGDSGDGCLTFHQNQLGDTHITEELAGTVTAGSSVSRQQLVAYAMRMRAGKPGGGKGPLVQTDVSGTLATGNDQVICFAANQRGEVRLSNGDGQITGAIPASQSGKQIQAVCMASGRSNAEVEDGLCPPMVVYPSDEAPMVLYAGLYWTVRRLMPVECERLQGFQGGWTDITYRGKPAADGPRYKAIGNSMAVPVMRWIGERIETVDKREDER